jgi:hypothetical protein
MTLCGLSTLDQEEAFSGGGKATAAAIPGAKLMVSTAWANRPPELWEELAGHIAELVQRVEASHH